MKKILLFLVAVVGLVFSTISVSSYSLDSESYAPGSSGSLILTISNAGSDNLKGVMAEVSASSAFTYTSQIYLGNMDPGTQNIFSIPFKVKENVKSGIYVFNIKIYGYKETTSGNENIAYKIATIPIEVINKPKLRIEWMGEVVSEKKPLKIKIINNGGKASDLYLSVKEPFSIKNADKIFVGSLENDTTIEIPIDVKNVEEGKNQLTINFEYVDELGKTRSEEKGVQIIVEKENVDLQFTQQSTIKTNNINTLSLKIRNNGKKLENAKLKFGEEMKLVDENEVSIGRLENGEEKTLSFRVYTELKPGVNIVQATIKYEEEGKVKEETVDIPIFLESDNEVLVFLESNPSPLKEGEVHSLSITVSNIGSYPISSVEVEIEGNFYELQDIESRQYLGNLEKDDYSSVRFKIKPLKTGKGLLRVKVKYRDESGKWKEAKKEISVEVREKVEKGDSTLYYILGIIAIAGIIWWKKRKG